MENELLIEKGKTSLTCGIYLTVMNLKGTEKRSESPLIIKNCDRHDFLWEYSIVERRRTGYED